MWLLRALINARDSTITVALVVPNLDFEALADVSLERPGFTGFSLLRTGSELGC